MTITVPKGMRKATLDSSFKDLGAIGIGEIEGMETEGDNATVRVAVPKGSDFEETLANSKRWARTAAVIAMEGDAQALANLEEWEAIKRDCRADGGSILKITGLPTGQSKETIVDFFCDIGAIGVGKIEGMVARRSIVSAEVAVPKDSDFEKNMAKRAAELHSQSKEKTRRKLQVMKRQPDCRPVQNPPSMN